MDFKLKSIGSEFQINKVANVHFFEFPKDYATVDDRHPFCELIFVSSGSLDVRSADFSGRLRKNDFIIHTTNSMHSLSCPRNSQTTVIIIGFECNCDKLKYFAQKPVQLDESEVKQLAEIVKEGRNVFSAPYDVPLYDMKKKNKQPYGSEQLLRCLIEVFLINLIRKYEFFEKREEQENLGFEINEIIKYIDNNFLEKITIDEISFLFRTNRSTLCKEFKNATGKTLVEYISDKKISYIKNQLIATNKSIQEIAYSLNFPSVPNFYAFFKKHLNVTPVSYRKINKQ